MKELSVFKIGKTNDAFAEYFVGRSYLNMLTTERAAVGNGLTNEPKALKAAKSCPKTKKYKLCCIKR